MLKAELRAVLLAVLMFVTAGNGYATQRVVATCGESGSDVVWTPDSAQNQLFAHFLRHRD